MTAPALLALFQREMRTNVDLLRSRIMALARMPVREARNDAELSRASSSIRGALRVVGLQAAEPLLDAIEAAIAAPAAPTEEGPLPPWILTSLLDAAELLDQVGTMAPDAMAAFPASHEEEIAALLKRLAPPKSKPKADTKPVRAARPSHVREMFQAECLQHGAALNDALLALEKEPGRTDLVDKAMRAAHSLKGAARVVELAPAVRLAHAVEELALQVQHGKAAATPEAIELALRAGDLLVAFGGSPAPSESEAELLADALEALTDGAAPATGEPLAPPVSSAATAPRPAQTATRPAVATTSVVSVPEGSEAQRVLRVRASQISTIVGLAGESLVEARRLAPLLGAQHRLRTRQAGLADLLDDVHQALGAPDADDPLGVRIAELRSRIGECRELMGNWIAEFEEHARRSEELTLRMYREATASRMRPLSDGLTGFPRLVRDLGRQLGKQVELSMNGTELEIDRDILEKIEGPLTHILRNCIDHGIEGPDARAAAGKDETGRVRIEARHRAGTIQLTIGDDGRGIDEEKVRARIAELGLLPQAQADQLADARLYDYIFAPGFSTADVVTDVSGRGVGLDVVQSVLHAVGGSVHVASERGRGTTFHLSLPVSRSVVRCVVAAVGGEPYAFPLARIDRLLTTTLAEVRLVEDRQYLLLEEQSVALVPTAQVLELAGDAAPSATIHLIVASDRAQRFGFVVDAFVGELDLVVQPLDPRLGRVSDVSAMAILPDGSPVLVVDVDDMVRSVVRLGQVARMEKIEPGRDEPAERRRRILVVDDSFTVRELERHLLSRHGYDVAVAVDGLSGWTLVRDERFDLVLTDVDMPRMDGIALTRSIKQDARLRETPVIIVSYRDNPAERARGLQAAADAYVGKSDFDDESLVQVVRDLIGEALP